MTYDPKRMDPDSPHSDPRVQKMDRAPVSMRGWGWLAAIVIAVFILSLFWWGAGVNESVTAVDRPADIQATAPSGKP